MSHGTTLPQPTNTITKDPVDNGHTKSFNVRTLVKTFCFFIYSHQIS